jgi:hypothetical protein
MMGNKPFKPEYTCEYHKEEKTLRKALLFCKYDGTALCRDCARYCQEDGHPVLSFTYMEIHGIEY